MVAGTILSDALIRMIDQVINSDGFTDASRLMLRSLLEIFQLDQAALFEKEAGEFHCLMALDRSGRILRAEKEVFSSQTLIEKSLLAMEPLNIQVGDSAPQSVKDDSLKHVICLPLARNPATVIFLGSQDFAKRTYSDEEMSRFKTAAHAVWLAMRQVRTQENLLRAEDELRTLKDTRTTLVYASKSMTSVVEELNRVAQFNVSILLLGESGVGKEELARYIHQRSERKGSFVAINCANLSESLLDSELFGYQRGAFTGASHSKDGLFKVADGGTLFLDEIGELPAPLQAKLLRAIQERSIRPVGALKDISIDVRIVSATARNLAQEIDSGGFRSDLFYRIQEYCVNVPPLRDRNEDIELLAEHFLATASLEMKLTRKQLSLEALQRLLQHSWPGNVRELKSVCRTAMILARESEIEPCDLRINAPRRISDFAGAESSNPSGEINVFEAAKQRAGDVRSHMGTLRSLSREFEKSLVKQLMDKGMNQVEIASQLGVSVRTLQRILNDSNSQEVIL
jgi:transcriptional regulator with PAS, ATPase and Fis domain